MLIYHIIVGAYHLLIHLAALFSDKARLWVKGRRGIWAKLKADTELQTTDRKKVWIHCASLGEFEQGRPLIEALKSADARVFIILSFYSPSGYEMRKDYAFADRVYYLPADTPSNARRWLAAIAPDRIVFVKYEFWLCYLNAIRKAGIPAVLVSAVFRPQQIFFKPWGGMFRNGLKAFGHIFVQDQASLELLEGLSLSASIAGDTRVDRVNTIASEASKDEVLCDWSRDKVWIAGSTWPKDEELIIPYFMEHLLPMGWQLVIVPHEPVQATVARIERMTGSMSICYSQYTPESKTKPVLIVDNKGLLNRLYQYGTVAYIGGGFGKGIHNTLEPAAWTLPVIFGPRYYKFIEARTMLELGGAFSIADKNDLAVLSFLFTDAERRQAAGKAARLYIDTNIGATERILGR